MDTPTTSDDVKGIADNHSTVKDVCCIAARSVSLRHRTRAFAETSDGIRLGPNVDLSGWPDMLMKK